MRYEVWIKDVKVYDADTDCDVRVSVEGQEIFSLSAEPKYAPTDPGQAWQIEGYEAHAVFHGEEGDSTYDKAWAMQVVTE